MANKMLKYQIGLAVLAVFTVGLVVAVLLQAGGAKADKQTYERGSKIAEQLNSYFYDAPEIPSSLSAAGIKNVPDTITYTKVSDISFKFCVRYQSAFSNFDSTSVLNRYYGTSASDTTEQSYLYLSPSHAKGEDCQTIEPSIYPSPETSISYPYSDCESQYDYNDSANTDYYACLDNTQEN